jgi:hypothetical protein
MRKAREVLRLLWDLNQSARVVAGVCGLARSTVGVDAKRLAWQLSRALEELNAGEQASVGSIRQDMNVSLVQDEILAFISMVKSKTNTHIDTWLAICSQSSIKALQAFARRIQVDYDAVKAVLDKPWSNARFLRVTRSAFVNYFLHMRGVEPELL